MGTTYYLRWSSKCLLLEGWPRWALGCCAWLGGSPCIRTSFWHRFRRRSKQFLRSWTGWRRTTQTHTETQTTESKLPPQSLETRLSSSTGISSIQPLVMTCLLEERPQHQKHWRQILSIFQLKQCPQTNLSRKSSTNRTKAQSHRLACQPLRPASYWHTSSTSQRHL